MFIFLPVLKKQNLKLDKHQPVKLGQPWIQDGKRWNGKSNLSRLNQCWLLMVDHQQGRWKAKAGQVEREPLLHQADVSHRSTWQGAEYLGCLLLQNSFWTVGIDLYIRLMDFREGLRLSVLVKIGWGKPFSLLSLIRLTLAAVLKTFPSPNLNPRLGETKGVDVLFLLCLSLFWLDSVKMQDSHSVAAVRISTEKASFSGKPCLDVDQIAKLRTLQLVWLH